MRIDDRVSSLIKTGSMLAPDVPRLVDKHPDLTVKDFIDEFGHELQDWYVCWQVLRSGMDGDQLQKWSDEMDRRGLQPPYEEFEAVMAALKVVKGESH